MNNSRLLHPSEIRQVAEANPIEEVIGADVPLKKVGASLVGLCPFHREKSPSLTVTPARQRFICFGCRTGGDVFGYIMERREVGFLESVRMLAQRSGIYLKDAGKSKERSSDIRPRRQPPSESVPERVFRLPSDLRALTPIELRSVAERRGLSVAGLELAATRGLLWFGSPHTPPHWQGQPSWIVTDSMRVNAQARKMDGTTWAHIREKKAYTLPSSQAAWPIGTSEADNMPCVMVVEGGPDLLAAHHFIVAEGREANTAVIAVLGAWITVSEDALLHLANKRVRIFPHLDTAGAEAALRWARQLERVGCEVDAFAFDGLHRSDGGAVTDLNDLATLDADDFEAERTVLERILPQ